jgi:hypothetical protein
VSTQVPPRAQRLFALWSRLPGDAMSEAELDAAILRMLEGPGRQADASAYRTSLVLSGAMTARRFDDGTLRFKKAAEFPTWPANGPGTAAYDAQLRELAAEEERQRNRADEEVRRNSPQNREREALVALIDERIDAKVAELRRAAESAAVKRARELMRRAENEGVA